MSRDRMRSGQCSNHETHGTHLEMDSRGVYVCRGVDRSQPPVDTTTDILEAIRKDTEDRLNEMLVPRPAPEPEWSEPFTAGTRPQIHRCRPDRSGLCWICRAPYSP